MAPRLREIPESQEFVDYKSLPGWRVTVGMGQRKRRGAWVIAKLTIEPDARTLRQVFRLDVPGGGITARLLRQLSLADLHRYGARVMASDSLNPPPPRADGNARGRPPLYSSKWYAQLAERYRVLVARGIHDAARELARTFPRPDGRRLTDVAMRSAIRRARNDGHLGHTVQGRAGG